MKRSSPTLWIRLSTTTTNNALNIRQHKDWIRCHVGRSVPAAVFRYRPLWEVLPLQGPRSKQLKR